jgi:hypothetical protein
MASDSGSQVRSYFRQLLADGARPFRYRGRVRTLLGLPEVNGVPMKFAKPLPFAGFTYITSKFSAESAFSDDASVSWSGEPPNEKMVTSVHRGSSFLPQEEQSSVFSDLDSLVSPHVSERSESPIQEAVRIPVRYSNEGERGSLPRPGTQPTPASAPNYLGGVRPHEVTLPEARTRPHTSPAGEIPPLDLEPPRTPSAQETLFPRTGNLESHLPRTEPELPSPGTGLAGKSPERMGSAARSSVSPINKPPPLSGPAPLPPALTEVLVEKPVSVQPRRGLEPGISTAHDSTPQSRRPPPEFRPLASRMESAVPRDATVRLYRDVPSLPRLLPSVRKEQPSANKRHETVEAAQPPWDNFPSSNGHAAPTQEPAVIVVEQNTGSLGTRLAFWERRHLTHLRVRIRR